jgi:hypothetical protein
MSRLRRAVISVGLEVPLLTDPRVLSQPGHVAVLIYVHNLMRRQAMSLQHSSDDKIQVIRTKPGQPLGCSIIDKDGRDPGRVPRTGEAIGQACRTKVI